MGKESFLYLLIIMAVIAELLNFAPIITLFVVIATFLILVAGILFNWAKRRCDEKEFEKLMDEPFDIHFWIPPKEKYEIKYAKQDDKDYFPDILEIPSNIKDIIAIRLETKINCKVTESFFGFEGNGKKPELSYSQTGSFRVEGSDISKWYRDTNGYYHIKEEGYFFAGQCSISGFEIKTFDKGEYIFQAFFNVYCSGFKSIKEGKYKVFLKKLKVNII